MVFLAPGISLAVVKEKQLPPFMVASIVASVVFWYLSEAFGGILTGMATDFNSGLLVVVIALVCWPKVQALRAARTRVAREAREIEGSETVQRA